MTIKNPRFRDIAERETKERNALTFRLRQLTDIDSKENRGSLTTEEDDEKELIDNILNIIETNKGEVSDPLFVGTRELFNEGSCILPILLKTHDDGVLSFESKHKVETTEKNKTEITNSAVVRASLTLGFLIADKVKAPPVTVLEEGKVKKIVPNKEQIFWKTLTQQFYNAIGEASGLEDLATLVLPILAIEGDSDGRGTNYTPNVNAGEFALVMRKLHERGITTDERQLKRRVNECLDNIQSVGGTGSITDIGIDLPDLDGVTDHDIVAENVRLMGPMIVSAMFDELKAFQVVDHLVERFQRGTLSVVSGKAGELLYQYWREAPNRISEMERRTFYATTMGVPGGEFGDFVNREFNELWLRFVSSVSEFVRQAEVDKLLRTDIPSPVSHQQVRKAARDLASNLSLHGYGMAHYAARELQEQIKFMIKLLGDPEIRGNYGARDMWQVIDQVATLELGGAKTSSRYRNLATGGTIITAWIANNAGEIMSSTGPLLDINEIRYPRARPSGEKASTKPNDYDLVNACELWLADTGTSDMRVEELAQPREAPVQTSRPVQVPTMVQDMLDGIGDLGVGFGNGR